MRRRTRSAGILFCLFVIVPVLWTGTVLGATIRHVPSEYLTIQAAIDAADPGDTVSVASGTYTGPGNVNLVIQGRSIIIEGSGKESTIIDCAGGGRAFTFVGAETSDSVLKGLTVTGGKVAGNGGAIFFDGASPTIQDCIITGNTASTDTTDYTRQTGYGGGIACDNNSSPTIEGSTITGNKADQYGGGVALLNSSSPTISDCDIDDNTSGFGGGGLYIQDSSPTVEEGSISNNDGGVFGGGVYVTYSSAPKLLSCLIVQNSAEYYGGGILSAYTYASSPIITNCTLADNVVRDQQYGIGSGGGIFSASSFPQITNSILWNDAATHGPEIYLTSYNSSADDPPSRLAVSYSDVKGGQEAVVVDNSFGFASTLIWDATNINEDPMFVGPNDYHLSPGSPCIDAGTDTVDLPEFDFEGDARITNGKPDLGADETIATEVSVDIDIKPGSRHKEIDLSYNGVVPVAVLSSKDFDARMIDPKSVLFAGAAPVRSFLYDVDRDYRRNYRVDMLFFFKVKQLDLDQNSTEATLTGKTVDGKSFKGTESVTIHNPKWKTASFWKWAKIKHSYRHKHAYSQCSH
jgi:parallel beta-helix repeat protein